MRNIPSSIMEKINQQNQTIYENANPKMSIQVSRAKTTVSDSTYWTVETIREKEGLGDLSLAARRLKAFGPPNRIYNIYVDNGIVKTAIREYPDYLKEKWKNQFELGAGTAVAIAFDGEWERHRKKWQLVTHENPWLFWVDDTGKLFTQLWDEIDTRIELASGVTKVKAIRAWKNVEEPTLDQGLVVGYIKTDGNVYYRNYSYQSTGEFTWEYEKQILEIIGPTVNLNMFITNDYRMGFITEDSIGTISWAITQRMWAGMAIPAENISSSIKDINISVIPIKYHENYFDEHLTTGISDIWFNVAEPIYPEPIDANNPNKSIDTLILKFNHAIDYDLSIIKSAFVIKDSLNTVFNIISTEAGAGADNSEIIFTCDVFGGASGNMFITYNRNIIELDCLNQGSRFAIESFSFAFTPDLVPPEGYTSENIVVGIINPTLVVSQVTYNLTYTEENIQVGIDISIVVTKVGNNPL